MSEAMFNALKPLAERLDRIEQSALWREAGDHMPIRGTEAVTLGELRAIRAALSQAQPQPSEVAESGESELSRDQLKDGISDTAAKPEE